MSLDPPAETGIETRHSSWHLPLYRLYEHLSLNEPPRPVDLIFVLAGRMERKPYGLELYRAGFAPRLLLSVGRYEVSKMRKVDFQSVDELIAERDRTVPDERHFFCDMSASGTRIEQLKLPQWNTYGEVVALREFLQSDMPRSVMVISTDVHLRRVATVFNRVFRGVPIKAYYCPVPTQSSTLRKGEWWMRHEDRHYVLKEAIKLVAYHAILSMPEAMIRRIMAWKNCLR